MESGSLGGRSKHFAVRQVFSHDFVYDYYVTYRFVWNEWQKAESKNPQQPLDGFTVSAKEDPMQVDMLCKTYETSDFAGRKMIRQLAEMSITDTVPTRRYSP